MPTHLSFPLALVATLAAIAAAPGVASGASWSTPELLSAEGAQISQLSQPTSNNRVAAAPDGSVVVAWAQNESGYDVLVARRYSASTGTWTAKETVSDANENVDMFEAAMDSDGNATLIWAPPGYASAKTSTLLADESTWSDVDTLASGGLYGFGFSAGPNGTVVAGYIPASDNDTVHIVARDKNATTWQTSGALTVPSANIHSSINFDFNASDNGAVLFFANEGSDHNAYVSRYADATKTWSTEPTLVASSTNDFNGMADLAVAPNGDVASMVVTNDFAPSVRVLKADGTLQPAHELGSGFRVVPMVVADARNRFIAAWETVVFDEMNATEEYSVSDPDSSAWSTPAFVPGGENAGASGLVATDSGQVKLVSATGVSLIDTSHITLMSANWSLDDAAWSAPSTVEGADATVYNFFTSSGYGSTPNVALAESGDLFAVWSQNLGSSAAVGFSNLDGGAPRIAEVSVPETGEPDEQLAFTVAASDAWSDISSVNWSFGDGATGTGASTPHSYSAAGTYAVTVTVTDSAGNETSASRTVTIVAPLRLAPTPDTGDDEEEDEPDPLPAILRGRTITLLAQVKLRPGKRCTGKATATTVFGKTTYRTSLKLATATFPQSGKVCVGIGSIKLKKTPSKRTKRRVTISSKVSKSRTVTTTRG